MDCASSWGWCKPRNRGGERGKQVADLMAALQTRNAELEKKNAEALKLHAEAQHQAEESGARAAALDGKLRDLSEMETRVVEAVEKRQQAEDNLRRLGDHVTEMRAQLARGAERPRSSPKRRRSWPRRSRLPPKPRPCAKPNRTSRRA